MNSTQFDEFAEALLNEVIAQTEFVTHLEQQVNAIAPESKYIKTPQRKARYSDKQRIRRKDAKEWALRRSGCSDTAEIKKYLKILGKKLDLRLTSAWITVNKEFAESIKQLKLTETFKVGSKVEWTMRDFKKKLLPETLRGYQPMQAYICHWFPLKIVAINDGCALLELWSPVPLDELIAA